MMKTNMINFIRPDYCPVCKKNELVSTYDIFENDINMSYLYDTHNLERLKRKTVLYMKCRKCNTTFIPNWVLREYPIAEPIGSGTINRFLHEFKGGNKNANR